MKRLGPPLLLAAVLASLLVAGFTYTWNEIHWGRDSQFLQNLLASGVEIVVDAVLVTIIVSRIVDYRETSRWRFPRQWLVGSILRDVSLVFYYAHSHIYTSIVDSSVAVHLPEDVRRLLDHNFNRADKEYKEIPKLADIPNRIRQAIDHQVVALNAELATFSMKVLEEVEVLAKPSLAMTSHPELSDMCADRESLWHFVFEPLERLHSKCERLASFMAVELTGTLRAFVDIRLGDHNIGSFHSAMLGALLHDFHDEFDSLQDGTIMQCKNFRVCAAPLFVS